METSHGAKHERGSEIENANCSRRGTEGSIFAGLLPSRVDFRRGRKLCDKRGRSLHICRVVFKQVDFKRGRHSGSRGVTGGIFAGFLMVGCDVGQPRKPPLLKSTGGQRGGEMETSHGRGTETCATIVRLLACILI